MRKEVDDEVIALVTFPNQFVQQECHFWCMDPSSGSIGRRQPDHNDDMFAYLIIVIFGMPTYFLGLRKVRQKSA